MRPHILNKNSRVLDSVESIHALQNHSSYPAQRGCGWGWRILIRDLTSGYYYVFRTKMKNWTTRTNTKPKEIKKMEEKCNAYKNHKIMLSQKYQSQHNFLTGMKLLYISQLVCMVLVNVGGCILLFQLYHLLMVAHKGMLQIKKWLQIK